MSIRVVNIFVKVLCFWAKGLLDGTSQQPWCPRQQQPNKGALQGHFPKPSKNGVAKISTCHRHSTWSSAIYIKRPSKSYFLHKFLFVSNRMEVPMPGLGLSIEWAPSEHLLRVAPFEINVASNVKQL